MEGKEKAINANSLNAFPSTAILIQEQQNNFVKTERGEEIFI